MTQMKPGRTKRPRRNKIMRSRGGWYPVLTFFIIVAAVIFAMSVFFKVANITVEGNTMYTDEEIIQASGIEEGDNLFFVDRISAVSRIFSKLPYVQEAKVTRGLPNRVKITVSESQSTAYIPLESENWIIDCKGKVLGKAEGPEVSTLIRVDGISLFNPTIGETAKASAEDQAKVTYLADILTQIQARSMQDYVTYVDMSTITNPNFDYLGRFTVKLGSDENTEYKFGLLEAAVGQLEAGDYGTIDLSIDKQAHFSPN